MKQLLILLFTIVLATFSTHTQGTTLSESTTPHEVLNDENATGSEGDMRAEDDEMTHEDSTAHIDVVETGDNHYESTATWNIIRERLFNGDNAYAYRFEEDIRLQVNGLKSHEDSAVIIHMVEELNSLMETVQIKMVETEPNFEIILEELDENDYYNNSRSTARAFFAGAALTSVILKMTVKLPDSASINKLYYHTLRNLTKLYPSQTGSYIYGGIFDSTDDAKASEVTFHERDKDLIRKLYSHDFYTNLRKDTEVKFGFGSFTSLRYKNLLNNLSYSFKAILAILAFLYFLSKESKRKPNPSLLVYLKQRLVIFLLLPFFFSLVSFKDSSEYWSYHMNFKVIVGNILSVNGLALLILTFLFYTEPLILKRINSFVGKQTFIFFYTAFSIMFVPSILIFIVFLVMDSSQLGNISPVSQWGQSPTSLFLVAIPGTLRVFYNFIHYRLQSLVNQKDVEIAKMKELKNQAELNAIHSRINPHFLYNSLNSIASLAHIDAVKTENMATGLSELFRYSINKENKTFVRVADELEMVKKYLEIEKMRFGEKLSYEIDTEESTLDKQIPKFLIQPLVENAIKHGISKMKDPGKVVVAVKREENNLMIVIFDNGPDFPAEPVSGYGLQNLHDKLDIIYGEKAAINWENGANKHFKVVLKNQFEA